MYLFLTLDRMELDGMPGLATIAAAMPAISRFTQSLINHALLLAGMHVGIIAGTKVS